MKETSLLPAANTVTVQSRRSTDNS